MKKRFLSLMIALVMVLGLLPLGVLPTFASEETEEVTWTVVTTHDELSAALATNVTDIRLGADIEVPTTIQLFYSLTLDLAGYTISSTASFDGSDVIYISMQDHEVTITDSSAENSGKVLARHTGDSVIWIVGDGSATLDGITTVNEGELSSADVYIYASYVQFENCSIGSICIESYDGDYGWITVGEDVEVDSWTGGVGYYFNVDPVEHLGIEIDPIMEEVVYDEEAGWWLIQAIEYEKIIMQVHLRPVDMNGKPIEGKLDVLLNGSDWVGTENCEYDPRPYNIGNNVFSNWDYCPDGYDEPTEDIRFTMDENGMITIVSGKATVEYGDGVIYMNVYLYEKGYNPDGAMFTGVWLSIGKSLAMNYSVTLEPELLERLDEIYMVFTVADTVSTVTDYKLVDDEYVFTFRGIAPQHMGDLIEARLMMGDEVLDVQDDFSVLQYCMELYNEYSDDKLMMQLVADLLEYGAAAQLYMDYNTNALVNDGCPLTPSEVLPTTTDKTLTESLAYNSCFTKVNVWHGHLNRIVVSYYSDASATLKVNGVDVQGNVEVGRSETDFIYYTEGIAPTDFDKVYTFELYENGALVQTLTYSINSYVYAKMADASGSGRLTENAVLARALYRYGVSATNYKEIPAFGAVEITDENADHISYEEGVYSSYDQEIGWTPVFSEEDEVYDYFAIELKAGDVVYYELFGDDTTVGLYCYETDTDVYNEVEEGFLDPKGMLTVEESGRYYFYTYENINVKAWVAEEEDVLVVGSVEVTDENEYLISTTNSGVYDQELGWIPVQAGELFGYFAIDVPAGEKLYLVFAEEVEYGARIQTQNGAVVTDTGKVFVLEGGDIYIIFAKANVSMRAYMGTWEEITDESDVLYCDEMMPADIFGSYDAENGWSAYPFTDELDSMTQYNYFMLALNAGDVLVLEFSEATQYIFDLLSADDFEIMPATDFVMFTAEEDGAYGLVAFEDVYLRAYIVKSGESDSLYIPDGAVEITDENADHISYEEGVYSSYDQEIGWTPVFSEEDGVYDYFAIELKAGDTVYYQLSGATSCAGLYKEETDSDIYNWSDDVSMTYGVLGVREDGSYLFYTYNDVNAKVWVYSDTGASDSGK